VTPGGTRRPWRAALTLGAVVALAGLVVGGRPWATLYDGVIVAEPYLWLDPPPGHPGNPQGATAQLNLEDGGSPLLAVATPELVPQAQVFAIPGALILPDGTTSIDVAIAPVEPPALPTDGHIAGNVYAITVTNQAGATIAADPAAQVSVVLRAPDPTTTTATVVRYDGTAWRPVKTDPAGLGATFTAVVTQFGDFAVLLPGPAPTAGGSPGPSAASSAGSSLPAVTPVASQPPGTGFSLDRDSLSLLLGALAVAIVGLVALVALLPARRRPPPAPTAPARRRRR